MAYGSCGKNITRQTLNLIKTRIGQDIQSIVLLAQVYWISFRCRLHSTNWLSAQQTEISITMCINTNNPKFYFRHFAKSIFGMFMTKIKLLNVTFVNIIFMLNVTTLIIQTTDIFKPVINPGTVQNVAARIFLFTSYRGIKRFQLAVKILIVVLCSGKDKKPLRLASY